MIMTVLFLKDNSVISGKLSAYHDIKAGNMETCWIRRGGATSRGVACRAEEWKEKDSQVFPVTFLITLNTN